MTDRERTMIEAYIPSPRDKTLKQGVEYYVMGLDNKVYKVHICEILPNDDTTEYGCYTDKGRHIKSYRKHEGWHMCDLYDNKQDCKNLTHGAYEYWEELRKIQEQICG